MIKSEYTKIGNTNVLLLTVDDTVNKGAIGVVEGAYLADSFDNATNRNMAVILIVSSSGINVHDGILGLMQMIKISTAVKKHSQKGLLYVSVIRGQVLGGASASFVSMADIIVAETTAIYGFSGRRIVAETTCEDLPFDFQTADFAMRCGMIDLIVDEKHTMSCIEKLVMYHER